MGPSAYDQEHLNFNTIFFWQVFLCTLCLVLVAGVFTNAGLYSPWYNNLEQAPWLPPPWVFIFGWTLLYLLVAFTGFIGLQLDPYRPGFLVLYVVGLLLNVLWTLAFFTLESVLWGFWLVVALAAVAVAQIVYLIWAGVQVTSTALIASGALLVLYLTWLVYASTLNGYLLFAT